MNYYIKKLEEADDSPLAVFCHEEGTDFETKATGDFIRWSDLKQGIVNLWVDGKFSHEEKMALLSEVMHLQAMAMPNPDSF